MSNEWVMHQEWAAACTTYDSNEPLERSYFQNHVATETGHGFDQKTKKPTHVKCDIKIVSMQHSNTRAEFLNSASRKERIRRKAKHMEIHSNWYLHVLIVFYNTSLIHTIFNAGFLFFNFYFCIIFNMLHHWKNKQGLLMNFSKINIYRSYTDAIQDKELNNITGSWELFLPGFCLNVHFLEVYTDVSDVLSACKWSIKYSIMLVVLGDRKDLQPASHLHCQMWSCSYLCLKIRCC